MRGLTNAAPAARCPPGTLPFPAKSPLVSTTGFAISVHLAAEKASLVIDACKSESDLHKSPNNVAIIGEGTNTTLEFCLERAGAG
jgi:hypothetical protein